MQRPLRRLLPLVTVLLGAALLPSAAQAATPIATVQTNGCPGAPEWRIAYRLYWKDTQGRETRRDVVPTILQNTQGFVDAAGLFSQCGARIAVTVIDEGEALWRPAQSPSSAENRKYLRAGKFDAAFYRFPYAGEATDGRAEWDGPRKSMFVKFSITPSGASQSCPTCPRVDPSPMLMLHEWMHLVVAFTQDPARGWPKGDVHAACPLGYAQPPGCDVEPRFFIDLLKGNVNEGGTLRGITPADFARDGTPRAPKRKQARWRYSYGRTILIRPLDGYRGVVTTTISRNGKHVKTVRRKGRYRFRARSSGLYKFCVTMPGTQNFRPLTGSCVSLRYTRR